jgi:hypothetical protein
VCYSDLLLIVQSNLLFIMNALSVIDQYS